MEDKNNYDLPRAPIRRLAHRAVQRQVVLTSILIKEKSEIEIEKSKKLVDELRKSVTIQMLPLYIYSNISFPDLWGQYTELSSEPVISNPLIKHWQWEFQFLNKHPEVQQAALVYPEAKLCANPFNQLDESKLYVSDEIVDLQNAGFFHIIYHQLRSFGN